MPGLEEISPRAVVNGAGFLNVDRCEREPRQSYLVNCLGPINLANAIGRMVPARRPLLLHFSSDFVFDGLKGCYNEDDLGRPLSYYGAHKLAADEFILHCGLRDFYILRMSGLICYLRQKDNFLKRMISLAGERPYLQIVDDLEISMVTVEVLAWYVRQLLARRPPAGLYNAVCAGRTTWHAILCAAFARLGIGREVRAAKIESMPNAALRPRHSDLDTAKIARALELPIPDWQAALAAHIEEHRPHYQALAAPPAAKGIEPSGGSILWSYPPLGEEQGLADLALELGFRAVSGKSAVFLRR